MCAYGLEKLKKAQVNARHELVDLQMTVIGKKSNAHDSKSLLALRTDSKINSFIRQ